MKTWQLGAFALAALSCCRIDGADYTYTVNGTETRITKYIGAGGAVVIPSVIDGNTVTEIGEISFYQRGDVTSVVVPDSVYSIDNYAFSGCTNLASVTLGTNVMLLGYDVFASCDSLTSIEIPALVYSIRETTFAKCTSLTAINVDPANAYYTSVDGVLFDSPQNTLVCYPAGKQGRYIVPQGVTTIGGHSFRAAAKLDGVAIPDGVVSIGERAFDHAGIDSVVIPNSVTNIAIGAFDSCANLTNVALPNALTMISSFAFNECVRLASIVIPDSVTNIDSIAFFSCSNLTSINLSKHLQRVGINVFDSSGLTNIVVPGSLNLIYADVFAHTPLISVTIEEGVGFIDSGAFRGCTQLKSITVPDSVTVMYNEVFAGCTNLQSAVIGTNLSLLRDRVFAGCSSLKSVLFKGNKPSPGDPDPDGIPTYNDLFLDSQPTVYYLPGTTGWGAAFVGRPAILWDAQLIVADPNFGVSAGRFGFKMTGSDGLALVVEASDDLNSGLWTAISTNVLQGGAALFKDSEPATRTARVYRFRSQ